MDKLTRSFYNKNAMEVAQDLLGKYLIHKTESGEFVAKIVETEAYMGAIDKAAHSYNNRRTKRTEIMFGPPGFAYVYLIYGMYSCFNVVANAKDFPEAVLVRALEPVAGLELMAKSRYGKKLDQLKNKELIGLTNGPGKLCQSMNISLKDNGIDLCGDKLFIAKNKKMDKSKLQIVATTRINIDYAEEAALYPYRYYIKGNQYVSRK